MSQFSVVVLAAGKGSRMKTKRAKVLHTVCEVSLLEKTLRAAVGLKPAQVVVVVGYQAEEVTEVVSAFAASSHANGVTIDTVLQTQQCGTGHAVKVALPIIASEAERVVIIPGDSPLISSEAIAPILEEDTKSLSIMTYEHEDPTGLGRIVRTADGSLQAIVEDKDCTKEQRLIKEVNASVYYVDKAFLTTALEELTPQNAQGEYYLTDIIGYGVNLGREVSACLCGAPEALWGVNTLVELSRVESLRRAQILEYHMLRGVYIQDPASTYIGEDVTIGADTRIGPNVMLSGKTSLETSVTIEGSCSLSDVAVGADVILRFACDLESATVGANSVIGPFARIRPGTEIKEGVKIGNFVETKKAVLEPGVKINHLSYIGDAQVGAESNVGAGTITCNYDGKNKHVTVIGERSFIGSNSALVAPVSIGDGAYVAAGSVISKDIPDSSLGIARGKQRNIINWANKK